MTEAHDSGNNLVGSPGELKFTVTVTRAATGLQETYELVGKVTDGDVDEKIKEIIRHGQGKE